MVLLEDKELEEYAEEEDEEEEDKEKESFEGGIIDSTTTVPPNSFFYHTITSSSSTPSRWVGGVAGEPSSKEAGTVVLLEKEHMFDKVVTPSDVGKLNRLVIPKQHAEKYFPLDSAGSEKGLLLNFEDGAGKQWRFRYSYWNSSQSYVMTKGWSRFVKDKKLDAGDIVSFERGAGELHRHRFFIDWKHRPSLPPSHLPPHHHHHRSVPWGRLFFPPVPTYTTYTAAAAASSASTASFYNLHLLPPTPPLVYESVPLMQGKTAAVVAAAAGKRVRLFGVNLDCSEQYELQQQQEHQQQQYGCYGATAKLPPQLQLQLYNSSGQAPTSSAAAGEIAGKQKQSLSLDLDI